MKPVDNNKQHRLDIDGLRAIAVVPVILSHGGFNIFAGGFIGVDIFFCQRRSKSRPLGGAKSGRVIRVLASAARA